MDRTGATVSCNFGRYLADACKKYASRTALVDDHESLRYCDLATAAGELVAHTKLSQLTADEPVLVSVDGRARDIVGFLGVWLAGGVVVPVHRDTTVVSMDRIIQQTGARYIVQFSSEELAFTNFEIAAPVLSLGELMPIADPALKGAAWIIFTSGSTGEPKGVVHGHDTWSAKLEMIDKMIGSNGSERTILVLRPNFIFSQWVACLTLMQGGTLIMRDRFDVATVLADLAEGPARIAVVPTMLRRIRIEAGEEALRWMAGTILSGGEPLSMNVNAWLKSVSTDVRLWDIYGTTETCACDFFVQPDKWDRAAGTIGRVGPGIDFRIAPESGELQIRSPFVMRGYLGDPARTQAAFSDGYFRTGDMALRRPDGRVELIGRVDDLINRGGIKVAPLEIERAFADYPGILAALATGVPDPIRGESVHVLVVPSMGAKLDAETLIAWSRERLGRSKTPDCIHFGDELPLGRTGKVDRNALRSLILAR